MTTLQTSAGVTGPSCKLVSWLSRSAASLAQLVVNIIAADPDDHIERHQMIDVRMQCILTNTGGAVSTVSQGHCGSHRRSEELPRSTGQHAAPLMKPRLCSYDTYDRSMQSTIAPPRRAADTPNQRCWSPAAPHHRASLNTRRGSLLRPERTYGSARMPALNGSASAARGAFIVFEGLDRCGKSTQSKKLVEALKQRGIPVQQWNFPDRVNTSTGGIVNSYLTHEVDLPPEAVHLLFSANRWEKRDALLAALAAGSTLVVDRYAYSGVAYSAAKQVPGMDLGWCKAPDTGLPAPDATLYLTLDRGAAAARAGYGQERYEKQEFQSKVGEAFQRLQDDTWRVLDASQSIDQLHEQVLAEVLPLVEQCAAGGRPLRRLWDLAALADAAGAEGGSKTQ